MKIKLFTFLFTLVTGVGTLFASNTQVGGIWYDFDGSNKTASVTYRGEYCDSYYNEYSGSISIPSSVRYNNVTYSVTSIGDQAFYGCSDLTSIEISNSVTSIKRYAFYSCYGLTSVVIPNSVKNIEECAFRFCSSLKSVVIPNNVVNIGDQAFEDCSGLISVDIGNSVKNIGSGAFGGCSSLASVTIPNSIETMGYYAFQYCTALKSVYNYATTPQEIDNEVFYGVEKSDCTLYVPEQSVDLYKSAKVWKDFGKIIGSQIPTLTNNPSVTSGESRKLLRNGNIYILTDDSRTYTLTGQKIR